MSNYTGHQSATAQQHTANEIVALVEAATGRPMKRSSGQWEGPCPNPACPKGPGENRFYVLEDGGYFCRKCCPDGSDKAAFLALTYSIFSQPAPKARPNGKDDEPDPLELVVDDGKANGAKKDEPVEFQPPIARTVEKQWDYHDAEGGLLMSVWLLKARTTKGNKRFVQAAALESMSGGYAGPMEAVLGDYRPLYGLAALAAKPGAAIVLVEGEKCADAVNAALAAHDDGDHLATTWPGGSAKGHWSKADVTALKGREVFLWPDKDEVGDKAMRGMAAKLIAVGARLKWVVPPDRLKAKGDAADLDADEVVAAIRGAHTYEPPGAGQTEAEQIFVDPTAKVVMPMNEQGLESALRQIGYLLRFNERDRSIEYADLRNQRQLLIESRDEEARRYGTARWQKIDEIEEAGLISVLAERFVFEGSQKNLPYRLPPNRFKQWAQAIVWRGGHRVDPFELYLRSLPSWDKAPRLDTYLGELVELTDADSKALAPWAGRYPFMAAVKRTFEPGFKSDTSPVYIGPPGAGKSTLARSVLPEGADGNRWFTDALSLDSDTKVQLEAILGKVIVEIAEMSGAARAKETVKTFLARTMDNAIRLSYARYPGEFSRRCIFVGTADTNDALPNDPNLRRFGPVHFRPKDGAESAVPAIREYMTKWRDQLWAEAIARN